VRLAGCWWNALLFAQYINTSAGGNTNNGKENSQKRDSNFILFPIHISINNHPVIALDYY
jgi:hypothetical protein